MEVIMKKTKHFIVAIILIIVGVNNSKNIKAQVFWIGVNGGATYSWLSSSAEENNLSADGTGWNLGFFMKYGKRPFYKLGLHWTHANLNMKSTSPAIEDRVPFHNFNLDLRIGYEIINKAKFKWYLNGGLFVGRSILFNSNQFELDKQDINNPQYGIIGGTGIQYMNFIVDLDYHYHLGKLFKDEIELFGEETNSNLQQISIKIGFQF